MMKTILILLLAALSGCTASDKLAECKGPVFALNAGHWQPSGDDLEARPQTAPQTVPGRP